MARLLRLARSAVLAASSRSSSLSSKRMESAVAWLTMPAKRSRSAATSAIRASRSVMLTRSVDRALAMRSCKGFAMLGSP